jgi:hypothetical protein
VRDERQKFHVVLRDEHSLRGLGTAPHIGVLATG